METKKEDQPLAQYRLLGKSGLRVSPLCLGTMNFGNHPQWKWTPAMDQSDVEKILDYYTSKGGNFIDTANNYNMGISEQWIGEWMVKRGNRNDMVVATKYTSGMGGINRVGNHRKNMFQTVEASLKRLQTPFIDLLYLHWWDFTTPTEEIMRGLDDLVRSGKVNYIAISDSPAWEVARANTMADLRGWTQFIAYQGRYHVGERDQEREIIPMAQKLGLGLVPWGVLGQGKYTGKYKRGETATTGRTVTMTERDYVLAEEIGKIASEIKRTPSQVILNWTVNRAEKPIPIAGVSSLKQLEDNVAAFEFHLSQEHTKRIYDVSAFELGFPFNFIGTDYHNNPWLKLGGTIV